MTTPQDLDERFREAVGRLPAPDDVRRPIDGPVRDGARLTAGQALRLYDAQLTSRHLDLAARWLRSFGEGFYTIGSAGHEGNAAVAAAVRHTDPALLHYRSGGFYCVRTAQVLAAASGTASTAGGPGGGPGGGPSRGPGGGPTGGLAGGMGGGLAGGTGGGLAGGTDGDGDGPAEDPPDAVVRAARDVLRGVMASVEDPISGGRHKVFGNPELAIVPTTSTIASHLPRAVGVGFAIERLRRLRAAGGKGRGRVRGVGSAGSGPLDRGLRSASPAGGPGTGWARPDAEPAWPADAIVVCSFGDASVNHASAVAAFNTTGWCDHTGLRLPILFVCEDNGLGISVRSPDGWVAAALRSRPGLRYFAADGGDLVEAYDVAAEAADWVRRHRRPAVLHLSMVRLMGHAGADAEVAYRPAADIARELAADPLVRTARLLAEAGVATPDELLARYDEVGWQIRKLADEVLGEPKLAAAADVVATLAPRRPVRVSRAVTDAATRATGPAAAAREAAFDGRPPERQGPLTLAQTINAALADGMLEHPTMTVFGEDVGVKGGVYGVTKGLRERFGASRVFDTLLDETSILGLGLGAGLTGMLPVPEIQYLAYLHNAEDQLRGEAATMQFFSQGAYRNPMVVRIAGLAYQEGFGGHFHNDNSVAVLRDIPGLVLAVPARPDDAAPMLRSCLASAAVDGSVCVFLEPIALYHTRDLYAEGDGEWLAPYVGPGGWAASHVPIGRARVYGVGSAEDLTIITFGNGVRMSLRAAARLAEEGIGARVVDLRWLAPLPVADLIRESLTTGRVLVVDETRRSGGVGEGIVAALVDAGYVGVARRVASIDTFIPIGPAAGQVLVSEEAITQGARMLLAR